MSSTNTANMNLILPTVGGQPGPDYAQNINDDMSSIDTHDHSSGKGVQITPAGMNINAALTLNGNFLTSVAGVVYSAQSSTPTNKTTYVSTNDLYFVDGLGNNVRLTQSGGVAGSPGSISNLTSPASAAYVSGSQTFVWQSGASIAANMDCGSILMRNLSPNSTYALTLSPPASLAANYTITLPSLPAVASVVTMGTDGSLSTAPSTQLLPSGVIMPYVAASAPSGWLICDGSAVSRSTYSALFAVIGVTAGQGNGSTTFNVPDYRGRLLRGVDGSASRDPNSGTRTAMNTGGNTGNNVNSVQGFATAQPAGTAFNGTTGNESATHTHSYPNSIGGVNYTSAVISAGTSDAITGTGNALSTESATHTHTVTVSSGGDSETRPINAYVTFIIKT